MQNQRLDLLGPAKPGETRGLTGTGPGLHCQEAAGWGFARFWNRTKMFFWAKPGPIAKTRLGSYYYREFHAKNIV